MLRFGFNDQGELTLPESDQGDNTYGSLTIAYGSNEDHKVFAYGSDSPPSDLAPMSCSVDEGTFQLHCKDGGGDTISFYEDVGAASATIYASSVVAAAPVTLYAFCKE